MPLSPTRWNSPQRRLGSAERPKLHCCYTGVPLPLAVFMPLNLYCQLFSARSFRPSSFFSSVRFPCSKSASKQAAVARAASRVSLTLVTFLVRQLVFRCHSIMEYPSRVNQVITLRSPSFRVWHDRYFESLTPPPSVHH